MDRSELIRDLNASTAAHHDALPPRPKPTAGERLRSLVDDVVELTLSAAIIVGFVLLMMLMSAVPFGR